MGFDSIGDTVAISVANRLGGLCWPVQDVSPPECKGPIPTLASNSKLHFCNGLQMPEEASASESASEIITGLLLNHYPGKTRQSLATTGFAARLV